MSVNRKLKRKQEKMNPLKGIEKILAEAKKLTEMAEQPKAILNELKFNIVESEETKDDIKYVSSIIEKMDSSIKAINELIEKCNAISESKNISDDDVVDAVEYSMSISEQCLILENAIRETHTIFNSLETEKEDGK